MSRQLTLELVPADELQVRRTAREVRRSYTWTSPPGERSAANIIDQLALVTGKRKSEVVADAVRLAAIFVKAAGPDALEALLQMDADGLEILVRHMNDI